MKRALKNIVRNALRKRGYEVRRVESVGSVVEGIKHETVNPRATYSPWLTDEPFKRVYGRARNNTAVDIYRCYELWRLAGQAWKVRGDILEVGVWRGGTGCAMAAAAKSRSGDKTVYLCDTFRGVVKAGTNDPVYRGGEFSDASKADVETLATALGLNNIVVLVGIFPEETGAAIQDKRFALCHIDVDVYQSASDAFAWVWQRMSVGGVVVFDDYGFLGTEGVIRFLNEETTKQDRVIIHNLNGHGVVIKTA